MAAISIWPKVMATSIPFPPLEAPSLSDREPVGFSSFLSAISVSSAVLFSPFHIVFF